VNVPFSEKGQVSFVCDLFGYRKVQKNIDINPTPGEGLALGDNGEMIVPCELVRLRKGDISVMYNVYFFKDAAIMRPESRYEVNSLLEMMKENPKYKIKIHGHTNGGGAGKIISKGNDSDNFFSLTGSKDGFGSAKKLSQERAMIIRDYLLAEGISEDRLIVKAWGGKRALFDKNHPQAQTNVRVEIEIVAD
jgi:outer membrane protein OmpA-like peptidoglycan-associated protein